MNILYRLHIFWLCRKHKIKIKFRPGRGQASPSRRIIYIAPIRDKFSYLVALHEIGHIVSADSAHPLTREVQAWKYAIRTSKRKLNYIDRQRICSLLYRHEVESNPKIFAPSQEYRDMMKWWS